MMQSRARTRFADRCRTLAGMAGVMALSLPYPAAANDVSAAFVEAFKSACVPQRLSYQGTVEHAKAEGWTRFDVASHPEFDAVMKLSAKGLEEAKAEGLEVAFQYEAFAKTVSDRPLHLIVSLAESEYLDEIGCYLYDFGAEAPIVANDVSGVLGIKPAQSMETADLSGHVWGPPPSMPRTLDTYLTYIPKGSPNVEMAGFDGVVLKFTTSAPDGEGQ
jgi:hypothetical protein